MNAKQAYLAWLRRTAPQVYITAIRKVAGKPRGSGGLTRDLVGSMSTPSTGFGYLGDDITDTFVQPDLSTYDTTGTSLATPDLATPDISVSDLPPLDVSYAAPAAGGVNWFDSITKAVTSLATTALNTSAQSSLLKLNTTRAQQGLPPVDANGVPVRPKALTLSTNPTLRNFEARISSGGMLPMAMIAGAVLVGFMLLKKR